MFETPTITREEFDKIYDEGKDAMFHFFQSIIAVLQSQNQKLQSRIEELEHRQKMNSTNSSKPPSSDGLAKPKPKPRSLREPSDKKPGGQEGHVGTTLSPKEVPDVIQRHEPQQCSHCGQILSGVEGTVIKRSQVADLPEIVLEFTEHQAIEKECPNCHHKNQGELPEWMKDVQVQYGPRVHALLTYLNVEQILPYERIVQMCEDVFGFSPSEGTVHTAIEDCYTALETVEEETKEKLKEEEVIHCDETGVRMEGKTGWLHVVSTEDWTYYHVDDKRGKDALERIGILGEYKGTVIHDCYSSYFQFDVSHGLCNAHLLRELRYIWEEMNQSWAKEMMELLIGGLNEKKEKGIPDEEGYAEYEKQYMEILNKGKGQQPPPTPKPEGQRGKEAKSKSLNLIERMERHRDAVLAFLKKENVPFTNNQAERDIRMAKVKMKMSGGFRTRKGACMFARIRAVISTLRKQGKRIFAGLQSIFMGKSPDLSSPE
jgi:transposase